MNTPTDPNHTHSEREREVIVTSDGGGRGYGGLLVAVLAIIVFGVLGYLAIQSFDGGDGMSVPEEVDVNVDSGGDGEG